LFSDILEKDKSDLEIISFALGALTSVMSEETEEDEIDIPADIGSISMYFYHKSIKTKTKGVVVVAIFFMSSLFY